MNDFAERRIERFAKVSSAIREFFGDREEAEEALEIAKGMLRDGAAETVAKATDDAGLDLELQQVFGAPQNEKVAHVPLSREQTTGNAWIHGPAFERSLRAANMHKAESFDSTWCEPIGGAVQKSTGAPLHKAIITDTMRTLLEDLRPDCIGGELELLEKAHDAMDIPAFIELSRAVIARLRAAA